MNKQVPLYNEAFEVREFYPDNIALQRIDNGYYREPITGIEIRADITVYDKKTLQYFPSNWRIVFPLSGIELKIKDLRQGREILWEYREVLKNVFDRLYAVEHPSGSFEYLRSPSSSNRNIKRRRVGQLTKAPDFRRCYLACL